MDGHHLWSIVKSHDEHAARLLTAGQRDQQLKTVYHDDRKKESNMTMKPQMAG